MSTSKTDKDNSMFTKLHNLYKKKREEKQSEGKLGFEKGPFIELKTKRLIKKEGISIKDQIQKLKIDYSGTRAKSEITFALRTIQTPITSTKVESTSRAKIIDRIKPCITERNTKNILNILECNENYMKSPDSYYNSCKSARSRLTYKEKRQEIQSPKDYSIQFKKPLKYALEKLQSQVDELVHNRVRSKSNGT